MDTPLLKLVGGVRVAEQVNADPGAWREERGMASCPGTPVGRRVRRAQNVMQGRMSSGVLPSPPGRRSCEQGRWSVARAPVSGWSDCDRGPQADAEERTRSAHRAIEIREKRRRVLSSRPAWITLRSSRCRARTTRRSRTRYRPVDAHNGPFGRPSTAMPVTEYWDPRIRCR